MVGDVDGEEDREENGGNLSFNEENDLNLNGAGYEETFESNNNVNSIVGGVGDSNEMINLSAKVNSLNFLLTNARSLAP